MKYQKSTNLLGATLDEIHRFITKKSVKVHDQSGSAADRYKPNKQIRFKTSTLRSDLCDYSDAYFVVKGTITLDGAANANKRNKGTAFKNNAAPFICCISKINNTLIDNAEDLDVVMLMYNLLDCSKSYRKTTGSLWNYYRDEPSDPLSLDSESFKYKTSITGNTYNVSLTIIGDGGNPVPNLIMTQIKRVKIKLRLLFH